MEKHTADKLEINQVKKYPHKTGICIQRGGVFCEQKMQALANVWRLLCVRPVRIEI